MERYRAAYQPESVVCPPPAVAIWYGEQVAPAGGASRGAPPSVIVQQADVRPMAEAGEASQPPFIQIDLAPEVDPHQLETHLSSAHILAKVRAPYDAQQQWLERRLRRLRGAATTETDPTDERAVDNDRLAIATYPTAFGEFSFAELYERSRKYAAFVLHHSYHVPPDEIEDGLQAGGVTLWKHLQQQTDGLQDKNMSWVGMRVVYSALHATRSDWKHRQQTQSDGGEGSTSSWGTHSHESRQADKRSDLHQAIAAVAQRILTEEKGKRQQHDLWALYGLMMLQVGAGEMSRLFGVREQSMGKAYARVRQFLQEALPNYAPIGATRPFRQHGRQALPEQEMQTIRKANGDVPEDILAAVQTRIEQLDADTRTQDELALEGIRGHIAALTQARRHGVAQWTMQRAYQRVHLMIGAERDPSVRAPRPERRVKPVFILTAESAAAVEQLALDLLEEPKSYEKLVALHAHIGNLGISTTAKHFNIPTSTLRYYSQQIGRQLKTPTRPAREKRSGQVGEVTVYARNSAAD